MGPFEGIIMGDYDLLLGKRTYDIFAAYWPYNQDNPIGETFQRINKYVLTHSDEPLAWEQQPQALRRYGRGCRRAEARAMAATCSSRAAARSIRRCSPRRLIDRLIVMTFPVVLGRGKRIFDGSEKPGALKLVEHFVSDKGVVFATYEPAGEVQTGTFATKEPSEAELELREKIKEGAW